MKLIIGRTFFAVVLVMSLAACARMVTIEQPSEGYSANPVSEFRVRFHSRFSPPFNAEINGVGYTQFFDPACPAANAICTTPAPDFPQGISRLRVTGDNSPSQPFDLLSDTVEFTPPPLELRSPPPPPLPPCPSPCSVLQITNFQIRETQSASVTVLTPSAPATPLTVTITPDNNLISLNNQAAGAAIQVTIPNNDRRANFSIRGIQQGGFSLRASAAGYQSAPMGGRVVP